MKDLRALIRIGFGSIEIVIGIVTFLVAVAVQIGIIHFWEPKADNVYYFVIITALLAFMLGIGLLYNTEWARILLIFFSGYVILSKILIYTGLMSFNGANLMFISPFINRLYRRIMLQQLHLLTDKM